MGNFSTYFPIPSSGGGGGALTNTYASFHVTSTTPGYDPSTGIYNHPEGGVFLQTGFLSSDATTYPNAVKTGASYSERIGAVPNPIINSSAAWPDYSKPILTSGTPTVLSPPAMHYVDSEDTIYLTYYQLQNQIQNNAPETLIPSWTKQSDGIYTRNADKTLQAVASGRYLREIIWDPTNEVWVGLEYNYKGLPFRTGQVTFWTCDTIDGTWVFRAGHSCPLAYPDEASNSTDNESLTRFYTGQDTDKRWRLRVWDGVVYCYLRPQGIPSHYNISFNASTYAIVGSTGNSAPLPISYYRKQQGNKSIQRITNGFSSFADGTTTTVDETFTDTTANIVMGTSFAIDSDDNILAFADLDDGNGLVLFKWSFTATDLIGDGTIRTVTTISGMSSNLSQTVFFKIG